ncbi:MAG: hypothetical protein GKR96_04120 [Gammaproteobacteria bacterium]|nr:hypothetical protein [Gammaproteobacteria bacterium]
MLISQHPLGWENDRLPFLGACLTSGKIAQDVEWMMGLEGGCQGVFGRVLCR